VDETLLRKSREALDRSRKLSTTERFNHLVADGVIDEQGKVLLWSAYLAVIAVKPGANGGTIQHFRCLQPVFGMPGAAEIDVSRDSMLHYVRNEGKRVITALRDPKHDFWREGEELHVTSKGFLRTDNDDVEEDSLGKLPTFLTLRTKL
jgi:hypothetical protein